MGTTELTVVGDVDRVEMAGIEMAGIEAGGVDADGVEGDIAEVEGGVERPTGRVKRRRDQRGMVSAEWAVGIIAAVALAGVLIMVVTKGPVQAALLDFILRVIQSFSSYIVG